MVVEEEPQPPPSTAAGNDAVSENTLIPASPEKQADSTSEKGSGTSLDRDVVLARVEEEKKLALVKAWEESEKSKIENKAHKKLSAVEAWEGSKKAEVEAQLKQIEEKFERKRGECIQKMRNKVADIHKEAQEKKAMVEAERGEEVLKAEETGSKLRARGYIPTNSCGCFG